MGDRDRVAKELPIVDKEESPNLQLTRRSFLGNLAGAGILARTRGLLHPPVDEIRQDTSGTANSEGTVSVTLNVNGRLHQLQIEPRVTLPDALRENLTLFGTKRDVTTGNARLAPCSSTGGASIRA